MSFININCYLSSRWHYSAVNTLPNNYHSVVHSQIKQTRHTKIFFTLVNNYFHNKDSIWFSVLKTWHIPWCVPWWHALYNTTFLTSFHTHNSPTSGNLKLSCSELDKEENKPELLEECDCLTIAVSENDWWCRHHYQLSTLTPQVCISKFCLNVGTP